MTVSSDQQSRLCLGVRRGLPSISTTDEVWRGAAAGGALLSVMLCAVSCCAVPLACR